MAPPDHDERPVEALSATRGEVCSALKKDLDAYCVQPGLSQAQHDACEFRSICLTHMQSLLLATEVLPNAGPAERAQQEQWIDGELPKLIATCQRSDF